MIDREVTTFDFGDGPVPAHQHPNGGGWVAETAGVAATAYVGPSAQVFGYAKVSGEARISEHARISGTVRVFGTAHLSGEAHPSGEMTVFMKSDVTGFETIFGTGLGNEMLADDTMIFLVKKTHHDGQ